MDVNFTPSFFPPFSFSFAPLLLFDISCFHWPWQWRGSHLHIILQHCMWNDFLTLWMICFLLIMFLFIVFLKVLNIMTSEITYMRRFKYKCLIKCWTWTIEATIVGKVLGTLNVTNYLRFTTEVLKKSLPSLKKLCCSPFPSNTMLKIRKNCRC